jgi:hypothetical protein
MSHGLGCFWGTHPKIKIGVCVKTTCNPFNWCDVIDYKAILIIIIHTCKLVQYMFLTTLQF